MASAATYTPIQTVTLTTTSSTVTLGNGGTIPQTYTDLVLQWSVNASSSNASVTAQFNGISTSTYSGTDLYGTGSGQGSQRYSNITALPVGGFGVGLPTASNTYAVGTLHIMNYANTNTYKTTLTRTGDGGDGTEAVVCLWRSTAAITSISLIGSGANFTAGSTFTLYGILAA